MGEEVIYKKEGNVEYIQFKRLLQYQDKITHAYSIGIDKNYRTEKPNKEELNKEEYEKAINDYKNLSKAIGVDYKRIIKANQMHTDIIENIDGKSTPIFLEQKTSVGKTPMDGLITNKRNINLATTNADCILLLFYDPVKEVIGNTHSGWKGTLKRISVKTVQKMEKEYGSNPEDIICCMCPNIRKCHFEVDKDTYDLFYNEFKELKQIDEIIEKKGEKWHIDTNLINKIILKQAGLKEENIIDSNICSVCQKDRIHSYRAEGAGYGLNTAIISIR